MVRAETQGKTKRTTMADLRARIEELESENQALRAALATIQGVSSVDDVSMDMSAYYQLRYQTEMSDDETDIPAPSSPLPDYLHSDGEAAGSQTAASTRLNSKSDTADDVLSQLKEGIQWPKPGESPPFYERPARATPTTVPGDNGSVAAVSSAPEHRLHVVHVTAEMAPSAKVGGLGDVVTGISKECIDQGHTTEVILPYYECLPENAIENLTFDRVFEVPKGRVQDGNMQMSHLRTLAWTGTIEGVPVILLRPDWEATGTNLFRGGRIYGGSYNETEAYLYFCRAALEYLVHSGRRPDVIHAHEWQASAVPMLYWEIFSHSLPGARPALTIHNMDNSGECRQDEFAATGVSGDAFAEVERALDERTIGHNPERLCLLKGGIVYSSIVTTVSPTYATETLTGGAAGWLRSTLARPEIAGKYWGVLNGIDTEMWDPSADPLLPACYSSAMPQGKALCKRYLQQGLGLEIAPDKPLVAVISRLVPQKGIHLIEHSVGRTVAQGGQFVLLGTGHADGGLRRLAGETYKDSPDVRMIFGYSETLAHLIYAAADVFLVPSMFEPCGLTQMIALRYGAVPVVRSTGGLADTVRDIDGGEEYANPGAPPPNGFVFSGIDGGSLDTALDRALGMYNSKRNEWEALRVRNLKEGERWSWRSPAQSYIGLYRGVVGR